MNYLGHIYLSGNNEELLVGNFIGDYVKGKQYKSYPQAIQNGILLHRDIDEFTDHNKHWLAVREMLKPIYKRYAGVVADIFVDHFLAANWNQFSGEHFVEYAQWVYSVLQQYYDIMPSQVQNFLPYFIQHRRLQSYATIDGIEIALKIMARRTSLPNHAETASCLLKNNYIPFSFYSITFLKNITEHKNILLKNHTFM